MTERHALSVAARLPILLGTSLALVVTIPRPAIGQVSSPPARLDRDSLTRWLDAFVPGAIGKGDIAGAVVSVVQGGEVLVEKGYGFANLARRTPMDPSATIIRAASLSKSFTATAVMQLVEQGKLDLDRDVNDYLDFAIPPAFRKAITVRHLLTHSAGFEEISYKRHDPPMTLREHVLAVPERIHPPGTVTAYSNYGLALAGYIVARVSGESFVDYLQRHVLSPLGMERSTFLLPLPASLAPAEAAYYERASSGREFPPSLIAELSPVEAPAAGLATTAHDMTRFMLAHLSQGADSSAPMLGREALRRMHAPAFVPIPGAPPVALGLFHGTVRGHRVIGHSGDGDGTHAEMWLLPDEGIGVFVALNSDGKPSDFLPAAFSVRAAIFDAFVARFLPARPVPDEPTVATARAHARLAAGEYAWAREQRGDYQELLALIQRFALGMAIRANDDGTITTPPALTFDNDGRVQTWREVGPFLWRDVAGDAHLVMDVRDGEVRAAWTDQVPSYWVDLRVPAHRSARVNVPLLALSTVALLLTVIAWPITAVLRRRSTRSVSRTSAEGRAERLAQWSALLGVCYMVGWGVAIAADFPSRVEVEPWIRVIQAVGLLCILGVAAAGWNAWVTWSGRRGIVAKAWSVVPALALAYLAWFSFAFHLISARID